MSSNRANTTPRVNSTDSTDYGRVSIPQGKPPSEYSYQERRAEIYAMMDEKGTPDLDQTQASLADRYDVCQQQISKDFDRIRDSMRAHIGKDAELRAEMIYGKAVRELQEDGQWFQAAKVADMWNDWLFDVGAVDRAPEKAEVTHGGVVGHAHDHDHEHRLNDEIATQIDDAMVHAEEDAQPLVYDDPTDH